MHPVRIPVAIFVGMSLHAACLAGALRWDQTRIEAVALPEQTEVAVDYAFRNTRQTPLTIIRVETSCPCTVATPSKESFWPGETGTIHAVFSVGRRVGVIGKTITVFTDEKDSQPNVLTLTVTIQQFALVEPRLVNWTPGGDDSERRIICKAASSHDISVSGVTCSMQTIKVNVETVATGREYVIRLHSPAHLAHDTALLEIMIDVAGVGRRVVDAYANFR